MIAQLPSGRKSVSPSAKPSPQGPLGGVLGKFLGKVFTHFSRPRQKFLADMLYGIQASGDTQLSSVIRAFTRFGKFCRKILDPEPDPEPAIIYQTLPGFEKFFNPDLC